MILIINRSKKEGEALATAFRYMGIVARAELPEHAAAEISPFYRAIILSSPEKLPDEREFVTRIRSYLDGIPIFALTDTKDELKVKYEEVAPRDATAARLYRLISEHCEAHMQKSPGKYMVAGIDASVDRGFVTYFSEPLPLTRTEALILRLLIRAYPSPLSPKAILKYAFKQSQLPEAMGIRTHICAINRKFKRCLGRNLIMSIDGGYVVMTPILAKEKQIALVSATK